MTLPAPDLDTELTAERTHLAESRAALRRMRDRAAALSDAGADVAGDPYGAEVLGRTLSRRVAELADDPSTPLFFGRLDIRDVDYHRSPARHRRRRRADGAGLAGAVVPGVLPGQRARSAGRRDAAPVRLRQGRADQLRGLAPRPG